MKNCGLNRSISVVAGAAIATVLISVPALAQDLVGQCRRTNQRVDVYPSRGENVQPSGSLPSGTVVILSDNGSGGLIGISSPSTGLVQARYLNTNCDTSGNKPPVTGSKCRRVIYPDEGLVIRSQPNRFSNNLGGVEKNGRVELTTDPATRKKDGEGREWVEITQPKAGWVSNGYGGSNYSNLGMCPQ
ncbi:SH3 domain-containing protein [Pantanalinema sp. GBBB05]|uniref:SH3 domain-containing protein n=1 Tax=Pantanalinema sp. GBBB05 TaxID=2604139 RepID=UPI001D6D565E|nr:SH3 domain-containing protein [Pantanalinema sp. GBBB05]